MEGSNDDLVATTKRKIEGEPVSKQPRTADGVVRNPALLNPMDMTPTPTKTPKSTKKNKSRKKTSKAKKASDIRDRVGNYSLLEKLAHAASRITFVQLARGDADEETKQLRFLLKILRGHTLLVKELPTGKGAEKRKLKFVPVRV